MSGAKKWCQRQFEFTSQKFFLASTPSSPRLRLFPLVPSLSYLFLLVSPALRRCAGSLHDPFLQYYLPPAEIQIRVLDLPCQVCHQQASIRVPLPLSLGQVDRLQPVEPLARVGRSSSKMNTPHLKTPCFRPLLPPHARFSFALLSQSYSSRSIVFTFRCVVDSFVI